MTPDEIERYVDAAAAVLGLPLTAAQRPGVQRYFALAATMAVQVDAHPLAVDDEPAEAFVPASTRPGGAA